MPNSNNNKLVKCKCKQCGYDFIPPKPRQKICPECKKKNQAARKAKRELRNSSSQVSQTKSPLSKAINSVSTAKLQEDLMSQIFDPAIWEERPVDLDTFLFDRNYLGNAWLGEDGSKTMFPAWEEISHEIFPLPMRSPYNIIILSGSTGQGKTSWAMGVAMAYYLHIVLCLRNPHTYFGLADQKNIIFATINIVTKTMAYKNAWGMINKMLIRSPWFMQRGEATTGKRPEWICTTKPVELLYGRGPDDIIGTDILFCFMDEISFYRNKSVEAQIQAATEVFNSAWERMKSRFIKFGGVFEGLMVLASSKRTDVSFLESFTKKLKESVESDKVYTVDKARWEMLPPSSYSGKKFPVAVGDKFRPSSIIKEDQVEEYTKAGYKIIWPPIENFAEFDRDMNSALTNIAGLSVGQISSFIRGDLVTSCIDYDRQNLFTKSVIFSGYKDLDQYSEYVNLDRMRPEDFNLPLFVHLDASLGRDGNSIVGVVADYCLNQANYATGNMETELHYRELFKIKIRAPQGTHTGLSKNKQFILWLSKHFNLCGVSRDQYQSEELHQDLDRAGIKMYKQSIDAVKDGICQPYEVLKNAMYEKRVTLLDDEDQTNELISLEKHESGKIDKPQGGQDDCSQCLAGAVYLASKAKDEILASGLVLMQNLDSSENSTINGVVDVGKEVAKVMEKHFSNYSERAVMAPGQSSIKNEWEVFFGKEENGQKKKKENSGNPTMYWG